LRDAIAARIRYGERDSEIRYEGLALVHENIFGLEVAVDHPVSMRIIQCARNRGCDPYRVFDGKLLLAVERNAQRLTLDEWHHVEQQRVSRAAIEQRQQIRTLQIRGNLYLAQESIDPEDGAEVWLQDLARDLAMVTQVAGKIDDRHTAFADEPLDL
jgi:hypothetical protein